MNSTCAAAPVQTDLTVQRYNRTLYGLEGTIRTSSLCHLDVSATFRRKSRGHFATTPFRVLRRSAEEVFNRWYVEEIMTDVRDFSDLPQVELPVPEHICKLFENVCIFVFVYIDELLYVC